MWREYVQSALEHAHFRVEMVIELTQRCCGMWVHMIHVFIKHYPQCLLHCSHLASTMCIVKRFELVRPHWTSAVVGVFIYFFPFFIIDWIELTCFWRLRPLCNHDSTQQAHQMPHWRRLEADQYGSSEYYWKTRNKKHMKMTASHRGNKLSGVSLMTA